MQPDTSSFGMILNNIGLSCDVINNKMGNGVLTNVKINFEDIKREIEKNLKDLIGFEVEIVSNNTDIFAKEQLKFKKVNWA